VGWRGIMFDNGLIWIDSEERIIVALNYESAFEKKQKKDLIEKEKAKLHVSSKSFEYPVYRIATKNHLLRIDGLAGSKYRYASWKIGKKESSKPDLILTNGDLEYDGSGGNHFISFVNGSYTYKVYRNTLRAEDVADITLEVKKDGKIILKEEGKLITE
jgi:hypothetical protein